MIRGHTRIISQVLVVINAPRHTGHGHNCPKEKDVDRDVDRPEYLIRYLIETREVSAPLWRPNYVGSRLHLRLKFHP